MFCEKIIDDRGLSPLHDHSTPILTVIPTVSRTRRNHRFHPFSQQQPLLYRPHLNLPTKERSPSPLQTGTHISRLYPEILAHIFSYLDIRDKGIAAQVCTAWREASYHQSVWRGVEAKLHLRRPNPTLVNSLTSRGIKRVQILSLKKSFREITQGIGNLTSLNLSGCFNVRDDNLHQAFASSIPTLLNLDLSLCKQITDKSVLKIVQSLENLENLELGGCSNVTDSGLLAIANGLKRLKSLNLRSCWNVSDQGIRLIAGQTDKKTGNLTLERLGLQDCQHLSDEALKCISIGLTSITSINLSFCINISDVGLKYLAKIPSLRELNLSSCDNVSDAGVAYLAEAGSPITSLDVSFCDKVTDQSLDYISRGLFNLRCLSLTACPVSDEGICKLAKALSDLEVLNIGQCTRITDQSLFAISESFKNLKCVDLYGCSKISTDARQDAAAKLPSRCILNLGLWPVKKS
ncbi:F-box/LRR-repeat protein 14-like [Planococcus citri]|uniref:F-box/LRR-repeat protein 14-like n=1 Tax=Planococcus citri TaxID=170843 RepID=UPI0031FA3E82